MISPVLHKIHANTATMEIYIYVQEIHKNFEDVCMCVCVCVYACGGVCVQVCMFLKKTTTLLMEQNTEKRK